MSKKITAVFTPEYTCAITAKASEAGFVRCENLKDMHDWHLYDRRKRIGLELMLLYDHIVLLGHYPEVDYSPLLSTGSVTVDPNRDFDAFQATIGGIDKSLRNIALDFKPVLVQVLAREFQKEHRLMVQAIGYPASRVVSELYDFLFTLNRDQEKIDALGEECKFPALEAFLTKLEANSQSQKKGRTFQRLHYFSQALKPFRKVGDHILTLSHCLAYCNEKYDSVLIIDDPIPQKVLADLVTIPSSAVLERSRAFAVLKMALSEVVGQFPKIDSINDVFELKESKSHELAGLRNALDLVGEAMRSGRNDALKIAVSNVKDASNSLNRGLRLSTVANWATYLSVPTLVVESLTGWPPVLGATLSIVGTGATHRSSSLVKNNNWITLAR